MPGNHPPPAPSEAAAAPTPAPPPRLYIPSQQQPPQQRGAGSRSPMAASSAQTLMQKDEAILQLRRSLLLHHASSSSSSSQLSGPGRAVLSAPTSPRLSPASLLVPPSQQQHVGSGRQRAASITGPQRPASMSSATLPAWPGMHFTGPPPLAATAGTDAVTSTFIEIEEDLDSPPPSARSARAATSSFSRTAPGPPAESESDTESVTAGPPTNRTSHRHHRADHGGALHQRPHSRTPSTSSLEPMPIDDDAASLASIGRMHFPTPTTAAATAPPPPPSLTTPRAHEHAVPRPFDVKRHFLATLAEALIKFGSPAYRMEYLLILASHTLKVAISCTMLPNLLLMTVEQGNGVNETVILTVKQGYDLDKLFQTNELCKALAAKSLTIEAAVDQLEDLIDAPATWSGPAYVLACGGCSAFVAPLAFGGSLADSVVAGVLGLLVGILDLLTGKLEALSYTYEVLAATLVAFLAGIAKLALEAPREPLATVTGDLVGQTSVFGGNDPATQICYTGVTLSTLFIILPGLSIATSFIELNSLNVISGTVRLATGLVKTLSLAFGILLGSRIAVSTADKWWPAPIAAALRETLYSPCPSAGALTDWDHSQWIMPLFLILFALCQGVQLRASPRQFGIITVAVFVAFGISQVLTRISFGTEPTAAVAAFGVGVVGNVYSRISHNPGIAPILAGILMLVPGGLGVRSSLSLIAPAVSASGTSGAVVVQMILISLCIALGVLCSRIVPPVETQLKPSRIVELRRKLAHGSANAAAAGLLDGGPPAWWRTVLPVPTSLSSPTSNAGFRRPWLASSASSTASSSLSSSTAAKNSPTPGKPQQPPPPTVTIDMNDIEAAPADHDGNDDTTALAHYHQKLRQWVRRYDFARKTGKGGRAEKAKVKKWLRRYDSVSGVSGLSGGGVGSMNLGSAGAALASARVTVPRPAPVWRSRHQHPPPRSS